MEERSHSQLQHNLKMYQSLRCSESGSSRELHTWHTPVGDQCTRSIPFPALEFSIFSGSHFSTHLDFCTTFCLNDIFILLFLLEELHIIFQEDLIFLCHIHIYFYSHSKAPSVMKLCKSFQLGYVVCHVYCFCFLESLLCFHNLRDFDYVHFSWKFINRTEKFLLVALVSS